jgi:hypothetical protein
MTCELTATTRLWCLLVTLTLYGLYPKDLIGQQTCTTTLECAQAAVAAAAQAQASLEQTKASIKALADQLAANRNPRLVCTYIQTAGSIAQCPPGFVPVGCASGSNYGSSFGIGSGSAPNGCWQEQPGVDWTAARCCHVEYGP